MHNTLYFPPSLFRGKILANMGIYDEFGAHFSDKEVLNHKMPVNFILEEPTPMRYIDPEFYIHNLMALTFLEEQLDKGVHGIPIEQDKSIIARWCSYHSFSRNIINAWLHHPDN